MRRLLLALIAVPLVLAPAVARADNPALIGTVGPDFTITLSTADGTPVTRLDPGPVTITVRDNSEFHDFHLVGPGVNTTTGIEFVGEMTWQLELRDGEYRYFCTPHEPTMNGRFPVGSFTPPPPPPPPAPPAPPARPRALAASVGPGARIAVSAKSVRAGRYRITVRDRSRSDNFHLVGPGLNRKTGVPFVGTARWTVTLRKGTYRYRSDRTSRLRGSLRVR